MKKTKQTNYFNYKKEEGKNPYTGFMSFQHFRGEKLYSDIVVRPENNLTETEWVECYPVTKGMGETGREEGYYPDTSIVYIRTLWKEFEPERGKYNYAFIEEILNNAKSHKQTLIFRLMPHSTCQRDDVPDWLRGLIDCPQRPDGKRVKDSPTDPLFIKLFCETVQKLAERFDKEPCFEAIDISLPGAWGEGHNLHLYSQEDLIKLVDTYICSFRHTRLIGQCGKPELLCYAKKKTAIGWRGDGLGEPRHTHELYPPMVEKISELWKEGPVSFESYWWLSEWKRRDWDIDAIIEQTLKWHISSFNAKSMPIPYEWKEKVDYWISRMGYHYCLDYFKYPARAESGDTLEFEMEIDNVGVAPIYEKLPLKIRLNSEKNQYVFETDIDITKWMPGKAVEKFTVNLPNIAEKESYDIEIGVFNDDVLVYLCTDAERNGNFYKVGKLEVNVKEWS